MQAGLAPERHPITEPGWPQRHAPVNNVPFTHQNHYPPEPLAPLARPTDQGVQMLTCAE